MRARAEQLADTRRVHVGVRAHARGLTRARPVCRQWHCAVVLEWEGRDGLTLVELAWLGGLGGYGGKSNWYADKDAKRTALFSALPGELKLPWRSNLSEIRFLDIAARNIDEFKGGLRYIRYIRYIR